MQKRYFLLDEPCPADEAPRMMCRVVQDKYLPLLRFAPVEPLRTAGAGASLPQDDLPHNASDIIPDILPKPVRSTNRKEFLSVIQDKSLSATLSTILGLDGGLQTDESVRLETKEVRRYTLSNPGHVFNVLMSNELYARDVRALLKETSFGKAYLVTGFLTTTGALWTRTGTRRTGAGANVTVPLTEVAGVPLVPGVSLDPGVAFSVGTTATSERSQMSPDEEIFAVSYAVVKLKFSLDGKRRVVLGPAKRAKARHLAFGRDDDSDSSDSDMGDEDASTEAVADVLLDESSLVLDNADAERSFEFGDA